ncbi:hypothetical protein [uncultured Microbacterium sp.]|uniref:hypothetical protein n=1 Tax=uncultured Microbacterium sp. TaxID=191216 RepID=UPI00262868BC|nr:hypothetical protein [uncultured Microbacterium sp.]
MKKRNALRLSVGAMSIAAALVVSTGSVQPTEAAWTEAEYGAAPPITTIKIPTPIRVGTPGCVLTPGLLGLTPSITITWQIPAPISQYGESDAEYGQIVGGLLEPILGGLLGSINTVETSPNAFTTTVNSGLLTGLLGASKSIGIRLNGPGGWDSDWLVANASMGLAGINPQCSMTTTAS